LYSCNILHTVVKHILVCTHVCPFVIKICNHPLLLLTVSIMAKIDLLI
jgi:hypothetical protein